MMISPESYIRNLREKPYPDLIDERDRLIGLMREFEKNETAGDRSGPAWDICPTPDTKYQVYFDYLAALCSLMHSRYNREYVTGCRTLKQDAEECGAASDPERNGSVRNRTRRRKKGRQEKIFEYRKHPATAYFDENSTWITVYDGPNEEGFAEYITPDGTSSTVLLSAEEIQAVRAAMKDDVLYETDWLEDPYQKIILDGWTYEFLFTSLGRSNKMTGSNIAECKGDEEHCPHSAHAISALEAIRKILCKAGVPREYLML